MLSLTLLSLSLSRPLSLLASTESSTCHGRRSELLLSPSPLPLGLPCWSHGRGLCMSLCVWPARCKHLRPLPSPGHRARERARAAHCPAPLHLCCCPHACVARVPQATHSHVAGARVHGRVCCCSCAARQPPLRRESAEAILPLLRQRKEKGEKIE